ncbi:trypsin-like peptidase domain-containing protein [Anabaena sp. UHCC 0253]|uniref:S1 family peptidase n=1 Tax=Anabaena sp. UHCC 0253 TaxID=2590019 RepID=UPI00144717A8|nr:serine protease [Anabaena sp. UHCC 0253]MTJ53438.1 trypsin-like peptidase domain-containing protein [Anabaena sp. UHCC 0253]
MTPCGWKKVTNWLQVGLISSLAIDPFYVFDGYNAIAQTVPTYSIAQTQKGNIQRLAQQTTVRILTPNASGSGVIIQRQGQIYTVLTNWHVVAFSDQHTIMTPDGQPYIPVSRQLKQLGNTDLAITKFRSNSSYQVASIINQPVLMGEPVFAAGFPMYQEQSLATTFDQGIRGFRFTSGQVSVLPPKSLAQGYRLGYTNNIAVGMSGGPIFNASGLLIGINGRVKNRDPDFGVYAFEDGTEPSPELLGQIVNSSWGIPISSYLEFQTFPRSQQPVLLPETTENNVQLNPPIPLLRKQESTVYPVILPEKSLGEVRSTLSE